MTEEVLKRVTQLKRSRASMKAKLTQFQIYLNTAKSYESLSELHSTELEYRLSIIEKLHNDYDTLQNELEMICESPDEQYSEREAFENQYFTLLASARHLLATCSDRVARQRSGSVSSSNDAKTGGTCKHNYNFALPKINIVNFEGNYQNWLEFRDTFRSLIHNNDSLDNISKFHYLRASLKGSAAIVVRNIDFTSKNYITAWDLLCERYDNARLLVNNHVQALFNVEPILKESSRSIRSLIDITNKNIRALSVLKQPTEHWDTLIIHMMSTKLDSITSRHWEEHRNTLSNLPTLLQFCKFLSNHADLLETLEDSKNKTSTRPEANKSKSYLVVSNDSNNLPKNQNKCPMCQSNHLLYNCDKFRNLPVDTRITTVKEHKLCMNCLRPGHSYTKCKLSHCRYCKYKHNTLLHLEKYDTNKPTTSLMESVALPINTISKQPSNDQVALSSDTNSHTASAYVFLSTALVKVYDSKGTAHTARILLDNGSTANFVTQDLCDKLQLTQRSTMSTVSGICNQASISSQSCNLTIQSLYNNYKVNITCLTLPQITKTLPSKLININYVPIPTGLELADPTFNVPSAIDILVGAETFWSVICNNSIDLGKNLPKLYETKLGWLVSGHVTIPDHSSSHQCHFLNQEDDLTRFWELDTISPTHSLTLEERACEESFSKNTYQDSGHFVVTMPLRQDPHVLGDSYNMAKCRFLSLERRFQREPSFKTMYLEFMKEYEKLGHMTERSQTTSKLQDDDVNYFIPHHGVIKKSESSVSLRTVFDASAVTSSQISLNNIQMVGPTVQDDLISILIRFRQYNIVVCADIEKMYRAISLVPSQRSLQQIIFRYNSSEPLKTYTLNTVTYGMACAPYLATKCLSSLADQTDDKNVKFAISRSFYVDDFIYGGQNQQEVVKTCKSVIAVLSSANFNLRKFQSNCPEVLNDILQTKTDKLKNLSESSSSKTLGLYWSSDSDTMTFLINTNKDVKITKRHILSVISQIFDPLGLVGPAIAGAKVIIQTLWMMKAEWDDEVTEEIKIQWNSFVNRLSQLNNIKISRWVLQTDFQAVELHTFTDASESIYGACIYARSIAGDGSIRTQLIASKNRVAPIKPTTIPRLELCGALLGARLYAKVLSSLTLPVSCRFWCDSTIVLSWLSTPTTQLTQFVRNRVNEINDITAESLWAYVPSQSNPADILTRPGKADLVSNAIWWSGPSFLEKGSELWPTMPNSGETIEIPEVVCHITDTTNTTTPPNDISILIHKYSNYNRLLHVVAYVQRFIFNCRNKHDKVIGSLTYNELQGSCNYILEQAQSEMFPLEHSIIKAGKPLPPKNRLISLTPFMDPTDKLMRVRGRLNNSPYSYDQKHPILLCSKHYLTKLIFRTQHLKLLHAGPLLLLANIRQTYWPLGGRNLAKFVVNKCVKCFRHKTDTAHPIMGQLPESRTKLEFPFLHCSVDYAGPVLIADRKGRGCKLIKSYLCIFVCMAVKAVHLELVTDLTKEAYMAALHRFISGRGKPISITSDNATTFVGVRNELHSLISKSNIGSDIENEGIRFLFAPAYSPHFNGIAEAAVRSTKHHLRRVLNLTHFTFEEMTTCLTQIEAILNSRPLTPLTSDPSDLTALTPAHFLIGRPLTSVPHPQVPAASNITLLQRHKRVALIKDHFWKRFSNDYVSTLQQTTKWNVNKSQLELGSLVILKDKTRPPPLWLLGRVTKVFTGSDNVNRVAEIRTSKGIVRRGWNNVCPLPVDL